MKTSKTVSPVLAVLILALALPLSACSSEPKAQPQAAAESQPISQEELDALRDKADKGTLTPKELKVLEDAEERIAEARAAKIRAAMYKGVYDEEGRPIKNQKNQETP